jgi:hypothetical protein
MGSHGKSWGRVGARRALARLRVVTYNFTGTPFPRFYASSDRQVSVDPATGRLFLASGAGDLHPETARLLCAEDASEDASRSANSGAFGVLRAHLLSGVDEFPLPATSCPTPFLDCPWANFATARLANSSPEGRRREFAFRPCPPFALHLLGPAKYFERVLEETSAHASNGNRSVGSQQLFDEFVS